MLAELLPRLAVMKNDNHTYRPRPSLAGPDRCLRQLTYMAMGLKGEPAPGRFLILLDDSSWHEELSLDWLSTSVFRIHSRQMRIECGTVRYQNMPYTQLGHIDALFTAPDRTDRLLEHKAIEHFTFQRYWSGEAIPSDYLTQCTLYFQGLQKVQPDLNEGVLLIKNKNTSAYFEYTLRYNGAADLLTITDLVHSTGERKAGAAYQGLYAQALSKFNSVDEHVQHGTLPPRIAAPDIFPCSYCRYQGHCWQDYVPEPLTHLTTLPSPIADVAHQYLRLERDLADKTPRIKTLKKQLIGEMHALKAHTAHGPNIVVELVQGSQRRLDQQALPPSIKQQYTKDIPTETLSVRLSADAGATPPSCHDNTDDTTQEAA